MSGRKAPTPRLLATRIGASLLLLCGLGQASAQQKYDYGGDSADTLKGKKGIVLVIEGIMTNPRNADNVVATELGATVRSVIPAWEDDLAGRLGVGYQWGNGTKVMGTAWGYSTSVRSSRTGTYAFPIGPPIGMGQGDVGTGYDISTEINARTLDIAFGKIHNVGQSFSLEWSVGLRHANYEETAEGTYANGSLQFRPHKQLEGDMFGGRAAVRGAYDWGAFGVTASVAASFLDGELTASSGMTEVGGTGQSAAVYQDDGRSGNIFDFDVAGTWTDRSGTVKVLVGWEQSVWEGLPTDIMRNLPGTVVTLDDRNSITFSGYKLGVHLVF
jgi:hypothetical protein